MFGTWVEYHPQTEVGICHLKITKVMIAINTNASKTAENIYIDDMPACDVSVAGLHSSLRMISSHTQEQPRPAQ